VPCTVTTLDSFDPEIYLVTRRYLLRHASAQTPTAVSASVAVVGGEHARHGLYICFIQLVRSSVHAAMPLSGTLSSG